MRGKWIEIGGTVRPEEVKRSLPTGGARIEMTLKIITATPTRVAPQAGAWIEITYYQREATSDSVAPPTRGAWIEMRVMGFPVAVNCRVGCVV